MVATKRKQALKVQIKPESRRNFGNERQAGALSGFSIRTLQKDRMLGRNRFPWYKVGKKVLYDLDELERIIAGNRHGGGDLAA